jgi:hypothetical protein
MARLRRKLRAIPVFPSNAMGGNAIEVTKANGAYGCRDARDIFGATGQIVPAVDEGALAGGIARLCEEVKSDGVGSSAARERILKNFSIDTMVSGFESQFRRLIE